MLSVNISTTYQRSQILVNSTATDRPISASSQTVSISISQVSKVFLHCCARKFKETENYRSYRMCGCISFFIDYRAYYI